MSVFCTRCQSEIVAHRAPPTKRQREIIDYMTVYVEQHRYAPSLEEIRVRFGLKSSATVSEHLSNLERKGWITRDFHAARTIALVTSSEVV